jgi:NAD(P)-dependent dehydrogenase (short-subunit alcohol dehydrogenase family)
VNCVRPGFIRADIHTLGGVPDRLEKVVGRIPMKRVGEVGEFAPAVLWLLAETASFVTGSFVDVAGGV